MRVCFAVPPCENRGRKHLAIAAAGGVRGVCVFLNALTNKRKQWRSGGPVARVQQLPPGKREESPSDEVT